jgi:hypothetical protein
MVLSVDKGTTGWWMLGTGFDKLSGRLKVLQSMEVSPAVAFTL